LKTRNEYNKNEAEKRRRGEELAMHLLLVSFLRYVDIWLLLYQPIFHSRNGLNNHGFVDITLRKRALTRRRP
jgi:hypothetical protein